MVYGKRGMIHGLLVDSESRPFKVVATEETRAAINTHVICYT